VPNKRITWEGWEDAAVPPAKLGAYLRDFRALLDRYGYEGDLYGHFGQGCVHTRIDFDLGTRRGIATYRAFIDEAADLVVRYGGSLSGEHGDGQSRAALLPKMFGAALVRGFAEFKAIFDPDGRMNPGKVVDPYQPTENLRIGGLQRRAAIAPLCCGRPLYDFGFLDRAKRRWHRILATMREPIRAGIPIVGLEPSCVSAFRDELGNLLPHDEDAMRLARQVFTLAQFLEANAWKPPRLARKAVVHGYCHHKAIMSMDADTKVLDALGLDWTLLDDGCCGLAGSFGFERGKYDVSMAIGETVLLPAVREARADTLILADGFSCREQIAHGTGRAAMHLAEVIALALDQEGTRP